MSSLVFSFKPFINQLNFEPVKGHESRGSIFDSEIFLTRPKLLQLIVHLTGRQIFCKDSIFTIKFSIAKSVKYTKKLRNSLILLGVGSILSRPITANLS